jgi:drug/metabolite transporter (DMT)-like permease
MTFGSNLSNSNLARFFTCAILLIAKNYSVYTIGSLNMRLPFISLLAVLTFGLFSVFSVFLRLAREEVSVVMTVWCRFSISFLILFAWTLRKRTLRSLIPNAHYLTIAKRTLFGVVGFSCFTFSAPYLPISEIIALQMSIPIILALLARYCLGEDLPALRKWAIGVGALGILLVAQPHGSSSLAPTIIVLIGCLCAGYSDLQVKVLSKKIVPELTALYYFLVGGLLSTAWLLFSFDKFPSVKSFSYLIGMALCGTVAQVLLGIIFIHLPATAVAPYVYTSYLWSLGFDVFIWGIVPDLMGIFGAVCIMVDGLLVYASMLPKKIRV